MKFVSLNKFIKLLLKNKYMLALIGLLFWTLWLPGPRVAADYHFWYEEELAHLFSLPQVWRNFLGTEGLGQNAISTLWLWPAVIIYSMFTKLGFGFSILTRLLGVIPTVLVGVYGINRLLKHYKISKWARFVGSLFFLTNTYFLLLIDGGQLFIAMAYSLLPLSYLLFLECIQDSKIQSIIKFSLATLVLSIFDIRIVSLLLLLVSLKFIFDIFTKSRIGKSAYLKAGLAAFVILFGFHAYWLLPALVARVSVLSGISDLSSQADLLTFSTLGNSMLMLQPHWFKNVFGQLTQIKAEFVVIPILAFAALSFTKIKKTVAFWATVALISIFLGKGASDPLPGIYPWLLNNFPGFSIFRDSTKFYFPIAFSYSVLIGFTVNSILKKKWLTVNAKWFKSVFVFSLIAYFLFLARPVWTGKMTGLFSIPAYLSEHQEVRDFLEDDQDFGRVLWIPNSTPLAYSSPNHPQALGYLISEKRPFAIGRVGRYEVNNFLREAPFMGELLDIAAIKYIAYPYPDTRREVLKQDNVDYYYTFLNQLANLPWVEKLVSEPPVALLQTKENQDHFFLAQNTHCIIGSDGIYNDLVDIEGFELSKNAFIFLEEKAGLGSKLKNTSCTYILYAKENVDLSLNLTGQKNLIFPADKLDYAPNSDGWWKRETSDFVWWRDFLQQKFKLDNQDFDYGGGWAIAEGNRELIIINDQLSKDKVLLARVMESSRGGKIEFYQKKEKIGEIDTLLKVPEETEIKLTGYGKNPNQYFNYDGAVFMWHEVGKLITNDQPLTIKTSGDINVINSLAVVDEKRWGSAKEDAREMIKNESAYKWGELDSERKSNLFVTNSDSKITFKSLSPTHYKVNVNGINKPVTLTFSEAYDPLWKANGVGSYPIYSLINGFVLVEDGEYDVFYTPQRYVLPGILISATTLITVFILYKFSKRKPSK
jgi:hypothetical protein